MVVGICSVYFSRVKPNVESEARRVAGGLKDSAMPPQCKAMVSQREVTSTSERGR